MMDSEKRLIIAIALSVLVIIGYQSYMRRHVKPLTLPVAAKQSDEKIQGLTDEPKVSVASTDKAVVAQKRQAPVKETLTAFENDIYKAVFTDNGAAIKELYLMQFTDKDGQPIAIIPGDPTLPMALETEDTINLSRYAQWTLVDSWDGIVRYRTETNDRIVIKTFRFHNTNYTIELELDILNKMPTSQQIRYKIFAGPAFVTPGYIDKRYLGADIQIGEKTQRRKPGHKTIIGGELFPGDPKWVSARSRYFSLVLKPEQKEDGGFIESNDKKNITSGIIFGPIGLAPNGQTIHKYVLYAGPSDPAKIAVLGETSNNVISYGIFGSVAKIMFKGLRFFYNLTGNYGIAIIVLALVISIILLPLTRKSLGSMKEMQKIQPEVEKIRKEHSADPQKMNKEIMELYKKHKVNPLGGCLPMLLQLPVFLSLYQVLLRTVELKGANFLWIKDLSEPDAAFTLPQKLPLLGSHINILPILMALAMAVQQKVSHGGHDASEQQKMMSNIMPVFMAVIFYNLPSGLVLYWLTNTLTMLIVQEVVLKSRKPA